jgi:hypothetical protein
MSGCIVLPAPLFSPTTNSVPSRCIAKSARRRASLSNDPWLIAPIQLWLNTRARSVDGPGGELGAMPEEPSRR